MIALLRDVGAAEAVGLRVGEAEEVAVAAQAWHESDAGAAAVAGHAQAEWTACEKTM